MARAVLKMTGHFFRELLTLPLDTEVICSITSGDGYVDVVVEHPDIPEAENQTVTPEFRRQDEVVFVGWNPQVKP